MRIKEFCNEDPDFKKKESVSILSIPPDLQSNKDTVPDPTIKINVFNMYLLIIII
jgi:hypothetical protein